jgi:ComF family protein
MHLSMRLVTSLLDLLAPRTCGGCDEALRGSQVAFCDSCLGQLEPPADSDGSATFACFGFAGPARAAIHRVKFQGRSDVAARLGILFGNVVREELDLPEPSSWRITPVPLSSQRLAERGFNQASELARGLARALGAQDAHGLVQRVRATLPQARLGRSERAENVKQAFAARPHAVRGRRVLVVDDVVTTGETLDAVERALLAAGAAEVRSAALARAGGVDRRPEADASGVRESLRFQTTWRKDATR